MELDLAEQPASESESGIEITAPNFHGILQWVARAIVCESEIKIAAPNSIEFSAGITYCDIICSGPPGFYAEIGGCSRPPPPPRINALRGWSVSALVAQKLNGAFNWS